MDGDIRTLECVTAAEAASMIGVTPQWIRAMVRAGDFVAPVRIGRRRLRFDRADILEWIDQRKERAA